MQYFTIIWYFLGLSLTLNIQNNIRGIKNWCLTLKFLKNLFITLNWKELTTKTILKSAFDVCKLYEEILPSVYTAHSLVNLAGQWFFTLSAIKCQKNEQTFQ